MRFITLLTLLVLAALMGCSAASGDSALNVNNECCLNNSSNNGNNTNNLNNSNYLNNTNSVNNTNNTNNTTDTNHLIIGCKNINDVLINGICTRTGYTCDLVNECDFGYACSDAAECECIDEDICGAICNDDTNCPDGFQCDLNSYVCKEPLRCIDDEMCDNGICVQVELNTFMCQSQFEGLANGSGCESGLDNSCLSGVCSDNVCVPSCRSNADCASGTVCGQVLLTLGCIPESSCAEPCDGPNQFCFRNICYNNACTEGGDCPDGGDCVLSLQYPQVGACGMDATGEYDAAIDCGVDEFRESSYTAGTLCMIHQACWNDEECPSGYECWTGDDLLISNLGATGFCGRLN